MTVKALLKGRVCLIREAVIEEDALSKSAL